MIDINVRPRKDGKFDIGVFDPNTDLLLSSDQGYENVEDAERIAYRLFAGLHAWSTYVGVSPDMQIPEPIRLTVTYRNGDVRSEMIR